MIELQILKRLGYASVDENYYTKINLWLRWYQGYVSEVHDYYWYNGQQYVNMRKLRAGMAKKAAEDWADLSLNEKVAITLEGEAEQTFWDQVAKKNSFRHLSNQLQELTFALGTSAMVARVVGMTVDADGVMTGPAKSIEIDYVRANRIFPLRWYQGRIIDCAFSTALTAGKRSYVYMQLHKLVNGTYDVENHFFDITRSSGFKEVPAAEVPGYEAVPAVFHTGMSEPLFVINRPNIVNNVDLDCPMGVSVYANALDQLANVDNVFSGFDGEITLGRKRVAVQPEALKTIDGKPVFDANDVAFYMLPVSKGENPQTLIEELGGDLRIDEYEKAMQLALNMVSLKCGLGSNHWRFSASGITTATEVISADSDEFRTLKKHELVLEDVLTSFVRTCLVLGARFCGQALNPNVELTIDFDDSIIEDKEVEFRRDCTMLANGTLNRYEFRAKWMNEDEKTAIKNLPKLEALTDDEPPEE